MERIDPALPDEVPAAAQKGIDDAVYGLMMVIEGVTGGLSNSSHTVYIDFVARLAAQGDSGEGLDARRQFPIPPYSKVASLSFGRLGFFRSSGPR